MKRLLVICLFQLVAVPFLLPQSNPAKQIGGWVITPRHETYPVNHSARATLTSTSNPSISLILDARFQAAGNRPQDEGKGTVLLSVVMENNDGDFQINPQSGRLGIPLSMSFDADKPIVRSWQGGSEQIEWWGPTEPADSVPYLTRVQFLAKLQDSKTLTISYPSRSKNNAGAAFARNTSATFDLSGIEAAMAAICPAGGCQIIP